MIKGQGMVKPVLGCGPLASPGSEAAGFRSSSPGRLALFWVQMLLHTGPVEGADLWRGLDCNIPNMIPQSGLHWTTRIRTMQGRH